MSFIHDERCVVSLAQPEQKVERRAVAFHAENALNNNESLAESFAAAGIRMIQGVLEDIHIQVRNDDSAGMRESDSIDEAGMVRGIRKNHIAWSEKRAQQSDVRRISGRKIQRRVGADEFGKPGFEIFPALVISRQ